MTSSNGNIFRVTGHLCGEFTGPGELPAQRPVTRSFDVFFDLRPNKWVSKQWGGWWLRRHRAHYDVIVMHKKLYDNPLCMFNGIFLSNITSREQHRVVHLSRL